MKVLLINPNRFHYHGAKGPRVTLPLGLMYIAAYLEKNKIDVKIFDALISPFTIISEMEAYTFHGVPDNDFKKVIAAEKPDIVGIGIQFSAQLEGAVATIRLVKEVLPGAVLICGGPHVSVAGERLLNEISEVDYGVIGEGEVTMLNIVNALSENRSLENIPGLIFRRIAPDRSVTIQPNPPLFIKDLDSLPLPAYHLMDMNSFFRFVEQGISGRAIQGHTHSISMITSRGCPFNCIFCSIHPHMGKAFRPHSPEYVVSHIEYVIKELGITHIAFEDDNLTFNPNRCHEIFSKVVKKGLYFIWNTPNGVRADLLDKKLLKIMKRSGCVALTIAPESGSQHVLDHVIEKKLKLEKVVDAIKLCHKLKIPLTSYFVIGMPGETKKDMQETVDFAIMLYDKYNASPSIFSATPLLGTRLYETVMANGYLAREITPQNLMMGTQPISGEPMIQTPDFSADDVKELAKQLDARRTTIAKLKKGINLK